MRRFFRLAAPLAILASALCVAPFAAQAGDGSKEESERADQAAIRAAVRRGEVLPLPRILEIAQARVPGDVVKVVLERKSWGIKYEVKILAATGRVRKVELDARTGAIRDVKDD